MKILAVIPARSGSKGLPDKNIRLLNNKPLIHYSIEYALSFFNKEDICFSSDDKSYINIAKQCGIDVPFIRPKKYSTDYSTTQETLVHALTFYEKKGREYDAILLLQPTSPIRKKSDIKKMISLYNHKIDMVVSVKEAKSNPYYSLQQEDANGFLKKVNENDFTRRQDCPKIYENNGSMYLINVNSLKSKKISDFEKVVKFEMSELYSIDIDTHIDFKLAEILIKENIEQ